MGSPFRAGAAAAAQATQRDVTRLPDYDTWVSACRGLPSNRTLGGRLAPRRLLPLASYDDFAAALEPALALFRDGELARSEAWLDRAPAAGGFFNLAAAYHTSSRIPFEPFAERHTVTPGTRLYLHGDLHGDIHSLLAYLEFLSREGCLDGFRLVRPEVRLVFLGDYTDRGRYGVEVMYTLLRLKLANPDQVILVRGNHEDLTLVARYGFLEEIAGKYGRAFDSARVVRLYDFLPTVLYVVSGEDAVQCNHGGLEPGFDPRRLLGAPQGVRFQLLGRLDQRRLLAEDGEWVRALPAKTRGLLDDYLADFVPQSPTAPTVLGFMWNDFTVVQGEPQFAIDPGRAFVYGDQFTRRVLSRGSGPECRLRAVFRGHQHAGTLNPMMSRLVASGGVFRHWQDADGLHRLDAPPESLRTVLEGGEERSIPDGSVWTFNVAPDSVYGQGCGFTAGAVGELVVGETWESWRLRVVNYRVAVLP